MLKRNHRRHVLRYACMSALCVAFLSGQAYAKCEIPPEKAAALASCIAGCTQEATDSFQQLNSLCPGGPESGCHEAMDDSAEKTKCCIDRCVHQANPECAAPAPSCNAGGGNGLFGGGSGGGSGGGVGFR